jgi:hypothetical protein
VLDDLGHEPKPHLVRVQGRALALDLSCSWLLHPAVIEPISSLPNLGFALEYQLRSFVRFAMEYCEGNNIVKDTLCIQDHSREFGGPVRNDKQDPKFYVPINNPRAFRHMLMNSW